MPASHALLIYSTKNRAVRRMVIPDDHGAIADASPWLAHGESFAFIPMEKVQPGVPLHHHLAEHLGVHHSEISQPRAAVVSPDGTVVNIIAADPELDEIPGFALVSSDTAAIGDVYDGVSFTRPVA